MPGICTSLTTSCGRSSATWASAAAADSAVLTR